MLVTQVDETVAVEFFDEALSGDSDNISLTVLSMGGRPSNKCFPYESPLHHLPVTAGISSSFF
jgi:hypothetical protein